MDSFTVGYTPAAARDVRRLDPHIRAELLEATRVLAHAPYPSGSNRIQLMTGITPPHFRLRIGDYRVIYQIEGQRVLVARVAHRREAYR